MFVGYCHSVMYEYETTDFQYEAIQIFKISGSEELAPVPFCSSHSPHL